MRIFDCCYDKAVDTISDGNVKNKKNNNKKNKKNDTNNTKDYKQEIYNDDILYIKTKQQPKQIDTKKKNHNNITNKTTNKEQKSSLIQIKQPLIKSNNDEKHKVNYKSQTNLIEELIKDTKNDKQKSILKNITKNIPMIPLTNQDSEDKAEDKLIKQIRKKKIEHFKQRMHDKKNENANISLNSSISKKGL